MAATTAAKAMLKRLGLTDGAADEITSATGQNLSQVEDFADLGNAFVTRMSNSRCRSRMQ